MASHVALAPPRPASANHAYRGWLAYVAAWMAATGLWTLASSTSARVSPLRALPYGLLVMGIAAAAGIVVWRFTGRLPWRSPRARFFTGHAIGLVIYAFVYSVTLVVPDLIRGDIRLAVTALRQSPVTMWSVLMGSWLYVMIAGISYAIRSERARDRDAAAAAEAKLLAQKAQLAALRAQLNPHFLFNALHTVSALIPHDPARADGAIEQLGELLRYAMAEEELVPLSSEWKFVLAYLEFEQLRLGTRLRVISHFDPDAAGQLVPPLLLQPIVENAVRHGVAARANGGQVLIDASVRRNDLVVRVTDNGPGERGHERERQGLGLALVRRRLAAVFGADARLDINDRGPEGGYEVSLIIARGDR